jgi:hypothetical protein
MHTDELRPGSHDRRAFAFPGSTHVTPRETAAKLRELARTARRLPPPDHRRPECFHEARDELGAAIEACALELEPYRLRKLADARTDWPLPYGGPTMIGKPIGAPPEPIGLDWIGVASIR